MDKILFLVSCDYSIYDKIDDNNHIVRQMFKNDKNKMFRILRKIHYYSKIPFFSIWYKSLKSINFNEISCCIVSARLYSDRIYKILQKKAKKIVFWYSNPVKQERVNLIDLGIPKEIIYSFDIKDCEKYGFRYNPQFFTKKIDVDNCTEIYDVLFVGKDKGRLNLLKKIERYLLEMGLKTYFYIVSTDENESSPNYKPYISYEEVIKLIKLSRVILDFNQEGQTGLTWRPLEALFLNKKLITNNENIRHELLYDEDYIKIVDYNNFNIDLDWINSINISNRKDIIDYYDFEQWTKRFYDQEDK